MRTATKLTALIMATAAFSAIAFEAIPETFAKAAETTETTPEFYMEAGAAVNLTDATYGGIRWTTKVKEGYNPFGANASDVTFGTFVIPTATYEEQKEGKAIAEMDGVVKVKSDKTAADALEGDTTYMSAIKYDNIIAEYEAKNGDQTSEEEAELLKKAYQMELTAISYAEYDGAYEYAVATETSRSARQVANMAILVNDEAYKNADEARKQQLESYVGVVDGDRTTLTNANEGYLDLSELNAEAVTAQEIDVSAFEYDFTNVAEVLIGGKRINYTYADGKLSVNEGSEAFTKTYDKTYTDYDTAGTPSETALTLNGEYFKYEYNQSWLSVFTADGKVYSLPLIPADGVIREAKDFETTFGVENTKDAEGNNAPLCGYFVVGNDITAASSDAMQASAITNGDTGNIKDQIDGSKGGFFGTLDGRGHKVANLQIRSRGIFGTMVHATVKNVAFTNVKWSINGNGNNLLFAYQGYDCDFENVYVDAVFHRSNGNALFGRMSSSTFKNFILHATNTGSNSKARSWGFFSQTYNWKETNDGKIYYKAENAFVNTYMISDWHVMEYNKTTVTDTETNEKTVAYNMLVDAGNWAPPTVGTAINHTEENIKRYLSVADMLANKYYKEDGTENTEATKTANDWTAFNGYLTIDTINNAILWNGTSVLTDK